MNILIIGSGGREHAFAWKMSQSPLCERLFIAPGNAGTELHGTNISVDVSDFDLLEKSILEKNIDLLVVGPEDPLVNGIKDDLSARPRLSHLRIIGPSKQAAMLEGSKDYAKEFMKKYNIPTAAYHTFTKENIDQAYKFLETLNAPFVLKADGLAAGKGVLIIDKLEEAKSSLNEMLSGKFGSAGNKVVIEEFLSGLEFSVFVLTDGHSYKILPVAKDYKRIGEGDIGLNTGGMGAISPVPFVDEIMMKKVEERIIKPTIQGIIEENLDYCGFVFLGLIEVNGEPFVIEYNCRMGDPETEAVFLRLGNDLTTVLWKCANGELNEVDINLDDRHVATVMMVSGGYPQAYKKGIPIYGTENVDESVLFFAGAKKEDDTILTNGGRVIAVSSYGKDMNDALKRSYKSIGHINFEGMYFRKDIGFDL